MKPKVILTDADGVLVSWLSGFQSFMSEKGHTAIPDTDHLYSMTERYSLDYSTVRQLIREYNESPFIADLSAHEDSVEYIGKLVNHGFKFICITSISSHSDAYKYRKENLVKLFGDHFLELFCLEIGSSKAATLSPWANSGLFWIEDHINNAEDGHELGLTTVLVMQDHNNHYETDLFSVVGPEEPWKAIYELVCTEYNLPT